MLKYFSEFQKDALQFLEIPHHSYLSLINDLMHQNLFLKINSGASVIYTELMIQSHPKVVERTFVLEADAKLQLFFMIRSENDIKDIKINVQHQGHQSKAECYIIQKIAHQGVTYVNYRDNQSASLTSNIFMHRALVQDSGATTVSGLMCIEQAAVNAHAFQESIALLDGSQARAHMTPILEIMCHEVSCKHGSAIGTLDDELLFYLLSRGISHENAKEMIVRSFLDEFFEKYCSEKQIFRYVQQHFNL